MRDLESPRPSSVELPRRRPLGAYAVIAAIVLVFVGVLGVVFVWAGREEPTTVPDLSGLSLAQAAEATEGAGLGLLASEEDPTGEAVVGGQRPSAGSSAMTGDVVRVTLVVPPAETEVPELTGRAIDSATSALQANGLSVGSVTEVHEAGAAPGVVVRQDPQPGTVLLEGDSVQLWIAGESTTVPDLAGLTLESADRRLQELGLRLQPLFESSDEGPAGAIVRQIPDAGTEVDPGAEVTVVVNAAEPSTGDTDATRVSPLYVSLAEAYDFVVLFPTVMPPQLVLTPGDDNPRHVAGSEGQGFEIAYTHSRVDGAGLVLMEGNWFETNPSGETVVDVRGRPAVMERDGSELLIGWEEDGVRYAVRATGLEDGEVIAFAQGLQPVDQR